MAFQASQDLRDKVFPACSTDKHSAGNSLLSHKARLKDIFNLSEKE